MSLDTRLCRGKPRKLEPFPSGFTAGDVDPAVKPWLPLTWLGDLHLVPNTDLRGLRHMARTGRIPCARKLGGTWFVPAATVKAALHGDVDALAQLVVGTERDLEDRRTTTDRAAESDQEALHAGP